MITERAMLAAVHIPHQHLDCDQTRPEGQLRTAGLPLSGWWRWNGFPAAPGWLKEHGIVPQTLVFLTDLCGRFPSETPQYAVIRASTEARRAPFGHVVPMEAA
jgi:hypothetical protein